MPLIGVVCEGSHDFCFMTPIIDQVLISLGYTGNSFKSLQPTIDATSTQLDGGGYEAVYQWLLANKEIGLEKFFQASLFATSPVYDAIVIQLDGDVADISPDFLESPHAKPINSVADRVQNISSWIFDTLNADASHASSILAAVPTLQMEAWIVSALRPAAMYVENKPRKKVTKKFLREKYSGTAVQQVQAAGNDARHQIQSMKNKAVSFSLFYDSVTARFT